MPDDLTKAQGQPVGSWKNLSVCKAQKWGVLPEGHLGIACTRLSCDHGNFPGPMLDRSRLHSSHCSIHWTWSKTRLISPANFLGWMLLGGQQHLHVVTAVQLPIHVADEQPSPVKLRCPKTTRILLLYAPSSETSQNACKSGTSTTIARSRKILPYACRQGHQPRPSSPFY